MFDAKAANERECLALAQSRSFAARDTAAFRALMPPTLLLAPALTTYEKD
jgi:hypothetical protein